jgi:hypothetical protein
MLLSNFYLRLERVAEEQWEDNFAEGLSRGHRERDCIFGKGALFTSPFLP